MKTDMLTSDLKEKWELITKKEILNGYKSLRISPDCIAEIYLGANSEGNHCLILFLPESHKIDFNSISKGKISINLYRNTRYLVLALQDNEYSDLFDDLILSLYNAIKNILDVKVYSKVFIQTFYRWSEFFEDGKNDRLSKEIIKGIFGELLVLKNFVKKTNSSKVNDILTSWKGPYDQGHDFVLDKKDIEVKTKNITSLDIRISSEFQLEKPSEKELELLVVSVEDDPVNGSSIKELVNDIKYIVINMLGDTSILLKAIRQKGITLKKIHIYDNFRFKAIKQVVYDCGKIEFPKLIKGNIPESINNVKYNIRLNTLEEFILRQEEY